MNHPSKSPLHCILCNGPLDSSVAYVFDTRFGIGGDYSIGLCGRCHAEQTMPVPSFAELTRMYETYYNFSGEQDTLYTRLREWFLLSAIYRLWLFIDGDISFHAKKGTGKLLDIGCNEGRGMVLYARGGYTPEGLEVNEEAAAVARSKGFTVAVGPIEELQPRDKYDVAVLTNVVEHSLDPKTMLSHIHRVLKPGGQLWVSCPNRRSWLRTLFGRFWINWHVPFHIMHFSRASLQKLLMDAGFTVTEVRQVTPSLWIAQSIISRLFANEGRPVKQLRNPLMIIPLMVITRFLLFPLLWLGNRFDRGDCLVVTAGKR